jgi:hypothetical protein
MRVFFRLEKGITTSRPPDRTLGEGVMTVPPTTQSLAMKDLENHGWKTLVKYIKYIVRMHTRQVQKLPETEE